MLVPSDTSVYTALFRELFHVLLLPGLPVPNAEIYGRETVFVWVNNPAIYSVVPFNTISRTW